MNGLYARIEPYNMFRIQDPDDNRRPDIEIRGLPTNLLVDVTVVSPLDSNLTLAQAKVQGRAAFNAGTRKKVYYQVPVTAAGYTFLPF